MDPARLWRRPSAGWSWCSIVPENGRKRSLLMVELLQSMWQQLSSRLNRKQPSLRSLSTSKLVREPDLQVSNHFVCLLTKWESSVWGAGSAILICLTLADTRSTTQRKAHYSSSGYLRFMWRLSTVVLGSQGPNCNNNCGFPAVPMWFGRP